MDTRTQAQIYLADLRGCSETTDFRSYHTFNFGSYKAESRQPFGALCLLNDDLLRAGASLTMQVDQRTDVILLPVVGGLAYKPAFSDESSTEEFLEPGQIGLLSLNAGVRFSISNPYEKEYINFLQLWLTNASAISSPAFSQNGFDLTTRNTLLPLACLPNAQFYIGQYGGRQEDEYSITSTLEAPVTGLFAFVLQGSFEVANRLLHERDGLSLSVEPNYVLEFEALSNDAILLLVELFS